MNASPTSMHCAATASEGRARSERHPARPILAPPRAGLFLTTGRWRGPGLFLSLHCSTSRILRLKPVGRAAASRESGLSGAVRFDQIDWARLGRSAGLDRPFLFTRYAMELMSCSEVYGFGRKR